VEGDPGVTRAVRASYLLDHELRLITASRNTLELWGMTATEIAGRKLVELFPYVEGDEVYEALRQALRSFQPVRLTGYSVVMGRQVEVEIYPVREGLQVLFAPLER
jgi:PAS domain S-box-containing protein